MRKCGVTEPKAFLCRCLCQQMVLLRCSWTQCNSVGPSPGCTNPWMTHVWRALLAVSRDFGGQVLDAAGAAALAQDVSIQRVAASTLPLGGQQEATFLPNTGRSQLSSAQTDGCHKVQTPLSQSISVLAADTHLMAQFKVKISVWIRFCRKRGWPHCLHIAVHYGADWLDFASLMWNRIFSLIRKKYVRSFLETAIFKSSSQFTADQERCNKTSFFNEQLAASD